MDDPLAAPRGIINGLLLSLVFWAGFVLILRPTLTKPEMP